MRSVTMRGVILGLFLTSGCATGRTPPSTTQSSAANIVVVDAARATDVLACAEEKFRTAGYATHRNAKTPLSIRAERESSAGGDGYEVNVAHANLSSIDGIPNVLRLGIWAETREFSSRGSNSGYTIRYAARGDVLLLVKSIMATCAKA